MSREDYFLQPVDSIEIVSKREGPRTLLPDEKIAEGQRRVAAGEDLGTVALELAHLEMELTGDDGSDLSEDFTLALLGGPGSGNFGHAGRPGEVGGSASVDASAAVSRLNKLADGQKFYAVNTKNDIFDHLSPEDREVYRKDFNQMPEALRAAKKAGTADRVMDITNIAATQKSIEVSQVTELIEDPSLADDAEDGPPLLVKWHDRIVIGDGHHRLAAAVLRGIKTQKVEYVDLDAFLMRAAGGPGSGNFGHAGRPGHVGGSTTESAPDSGGGGGASIGVPDKVWTNKHHQTAAEISGKTPTDTPLKTYTAYHVTRRENVDAILTNGFDLRKVKPRWTNDYAVSLSRGEKAARDYFTKRDPKTGKAVATGMSEQYVLLEVKVKGRLYKQDFGSPVGRASSPQDFSRQLIDQGLDGQDLSGTLFINNPRAITSIRALPSAKIKTLLGRTIHDIADSHVKRISVILRSAFLQARRTLTRTRDEDTAVKTMQRVLEPKLRAALQRVLIDGGEFAASKLDLRTAGGPGSGNFGHAGRPGQVGGSSTGGGVAVGLESDVYKHYPNAPDLRDIEVDAEAIGEQLLDNGHLDDEGFLSLYHVTLSEPRDILEQGLIPAKEIAPGQDWQAEHSQYATYFFRDREHAIDQAQQSGEGASVIRAQLAVTEHVLRRLVPDEDADVNPRHGIQALLAGENLAVIGGVPSYALTEIPVPRRRGAGGPGSGNFGHAGRPGQVGGSGSWSGVEKLDRLEKYFIPPYSKTSTIAFHGTVSSALQSIKERGLVPAGGRGADEWARQNLPSQHQQFVIGERTVSVFMAEDSETAKIYANYATGQNPGSKAVLLAIQVPEESKHLIKRDEFESQGIRFVGTIPPEWVRQVEPDGTLKALESVTVYAVLLVDEDEMRGAATKIKFQFNAANRHAILWAKKHSAELVTDISETSRKRIRTAIAGLASGQDWNDAIDVIFEAVGDDDRAEMIARHETMTAVSEGQRQAWDQAVDRGLLSGEEERTWIVTPDDKLCPTCEALDGQTTKLGGQYAGGIDGPPAHVGCRCTEGIQ